MSIDMTTLLQKPACHPDLKGQVALVTGGGSGIGRGIAVRLAAEGMGVAICGRRAERIAETVQLIEARGGQGFAKTADVGNPESLAEFLAAAEARFGPADAVVHNAMQMRMKPLPEVTPELWEETFATACRAAFELVRRVAPGMRERGRGGIVFISSVGGGRAHLPGLPYDPAKGAQDAMVRALAIELGPHGIRVNAVAPGPIQSWRELTAETLANDKVPLRRSGTPAEVGALVAFVLSDQASFLTGQVIYLDGGIMAQLSLPGVWL